MQAMHRTLAGLAHGLHLPGDCVAVFIPPICDSMPGSNYNSCSELQNDLDPVRVNSGQFAVDVPG
jgi:hypothetical protein